MGCISTAKGWGGKRTLMAEKKKRLDLWMADLGLAATRSLAQRIILAGQVTVNGQMVQQPGAMIPDGAAIEVKSPPPFVSRGGEKLAAALDQFSLIPFEWVCADVGASTGGFTDCLLQRGAAKVYAIDVGKGILDWKLRNDPRVVVMEETNARFVLALPELVQFITIDAAFISLRILLPVALHWLEPEGKMVVLIKPQFEAGKGQVGKGGVVRDPDVHRTVLREVLLAAHTIGLNTHGLIVSPLKGPAGNIEFLAWLERGSAQSELEQCIESVVTDK
jgi:23S rRNA (cytidine1920-2'-O)/16S rRNA (cytidine1409-2'-O)-methyltransferase